MSGFEHYERELAEMDQEIRRYAAICGVNLNNRHEVDACLNEPHDGRPRDRAQETLQGLIILRLKLEVEMLEQGFAPPPLVKPAVTDRK